MKKKQQIKDYLLQLQADLCLQLSEEDGKGTFRQEHWIRPEGGGGCSCILENGQVIEQAGVNFSHVYGNHLPASAIHSPHATTAVKHSFTETHSTSGTRVSSDRENLKNSSFEAMGISVVIHPLNPYVPTSHMNVRFFSAEKPKSESKKETGKKFENESESENESDNESIWWFGGGFDLTPYYPFEEDCIHWHKTAKNACDPFGETIYAQYKNWCDQYFYLKHRQEPRGIGGLFFDDLNTWPLETCFAFMRSIGDHFIQAYRPILAKRKNIPFGDRERAFQLYRRGRYVEFNLLYDRGTLFGLQSGGRTESILMSLPPEVNWRYNWQPEAGSEEAKLQNILNIKEWI